VDAYVAMEFQRLLWIRLHQKELRAEKYCGLYTAAELQGTSSSNIGKRIIIPSTFTGGARYTRENRKDATTICAFKGFPSLFITFTCNPKWPELVTLFQTLNTCAEDRPDILARVFKIKLDQMIRDLTKDQIFGKTIAGELIVYIHNNLCCIFTFNPKLFRFKYNSLKC